MTTDVTWIFSELLGEVIPNYAVNLFAEAVAAQGISYKNVLYHRRSYRRQERLFGDAMTDEVL